VYRAALLIALLTLLTGCGSDGDEGAATTATLSSGDVESAVRTELSQGGSGIVELDNDPPKQVTCRKDAGTASGWRCTVTPSKSGEDYLCLVEVDPQTKRTTQTTCARIDN
jgi:hypothetical protein